MYLLDTNTWSFFLKETSPALMKRLAQAGTSSLIMSSIAWFELRYGAELAPPSKQPRLQAKLGALSSELAIVSFDASAAEATARVRAELKARGLPIGPYDVQLAGHALALGATLVTNNTREFQRVTGLKLEDWTVASGGY